MKNIVTIKKKINNFNKKIAVSSDKSLSIRCVLLSSIAIGKSRLSNLLESEDILNTFKAIKKLGINYKKKKNFFEVEGFGFNGYNTKKKITIYAGNSGTLARLLCGLLVKAENKIRLIGDESLSKRDFSRLKFLKLFGVDIKTKNGFLPLEIQGSKFLRPAKITEKLGSAQVKSCAIFGGLNTPGTTFIKAKKSRNHTELLLKYLKYPIIVKSKGAYDYIKLKGLNHLKAFNYDVPGDISSAAFFIVLTLLSKNSKILIKKVNVNKTRIGVIKILNKMNAKIQIKNKRLYKGEETADIYVKSKNNLKSINCPKKLNSFAIDEFLVIFLAASKAKGISSFKNLDELNKKESPRLDVAVKFLKMIGVKVIRKKNNIQIYGNPDLDLKGKFNIKNYLKDHRIFMMSCIAALSFGGSWHIHDKDSINTSFPSFLKIIKFLGGKYEIK